MTEFLHDAEYRTDSWKRRHSPEAIAQLGVWRWKGIQQNARRILNIICGKFVADFGGADAPLGFGSLVVDAKADIKQLEDLPWRPDVIFTSHTLEHLDDPQAWLDQAYANMVSGGVLVVHVPSHTCRRWRSGVYANPNQKEKHKHTFCLSTEFRIEEIQTLSPEWWQRIDSMIVLAGFEIETTEYVGDDSILVIARKP